MLDLWKAGNGQHHLGIVVTFITAEWELHTVALGAVPLDVSHTAVNIRNEVTKVLKEFRIVPTVYVADNASNQVKCNDLLADWTNQLLFTEGDEVGTHFLLPVLLTVR